MLGEKESQAYQLFQQTQNQPATLKKKKKKNQINTYFINDNYKAQQLISPMNESLHLKREKKVTKTPRDVTKGGYLGKEWCPVSLGT